ncbi:MAG: carbon-nitrogen hydrolase family protein [Anaerolineae bacterium]|nr:carbon-nitrogen hydrolase family protein [Anaerolineae bacterium]
MRIGLVQMVCEKAALRENLAQMATIYAEAVERDVDVVGFPEMCLTGYVDPLKWPKAVLPLNSPEVTSAVALTRGCATVLLFGLVETHPDGDKPYITQIVARDGSVLGIYRKRTVVDEEADWFSPGGPVLIFTHDDVTCGIAICADIGNRSVFADLTAQGARLVFELAAPGLYGAQETRNWQSGFTWWEGECRDHLGAYAREFGLWIAVATQAGRTIDEDFPGGAFCFAPTGERVFASPDGAPGVVWLAVDL